MAGCYIYFVEGYEVADAECAPYQGASSGLQLCEVCVSATDALDCKEYDLTSQAPFVGDILEREWSRKNMLGFTCHAYGDWKTRAWILARYPLMKQELSYMREPRFWVCQAHADIEAFKMQFWKCVCQAKTRPLAREKRAQ